MFNDPAQLILVVILLILFLIQVYLAIKNISLFPILVVNLGVFVAIYLTGIYTLSTAIIPFFLLILDFGLGVLFIATVTAKKSVRVMQTDFTYLLNFLIYSFIFSWVLLMFAVLLSNS